MSFQLESLPGHESPERARELADVLYSADAPSNEYFDPAVYKNVEQFPNVTVAYMLPFSNHDNTSLMSIAGVYAFLFMLGTCGNVGILAVIHYVKGGETRSRNRNNSTLTYIAILCVVDFVSMLPLPMTIIDQILGFWMFGTFACKLFRLLEHIGKIFSTFILVAFSVDRYMAVCHPLKTQYRTPKVVYTMLGVMFALTCAMLSPILLYAHSKELVMQQRYDPVTKVLTKLHLYKCVDDLGDELFVGFTLYCFVFSYAVPLLMMIYFYHAMLVRLFEQSRASQGLRGRRIEDRIPIFRIAVYTLAICLFHFVCWTPYWCSILYGLWAEVSSNVIETSNGYIYMMYGIHALPYVNSASNFILYGMLNRQVRQLHRNNSRRRTGKGTVVSSTLNAPPALKFTECTENNGHSFMTDSQAPKTPPSTPNGRLGKFTNGDRVSEKSPLVQNNSGDKYAANGGAVNSTIAVRKPISEFKLDEGDSIIM